MEGTSNPLTNQAHTRPDARNQYRIKQRQDLSWSPTGSTSTQKAHRTPLGTRGGLHQSRETSQNSIYSPGKDPVHLQSSTGVPGQDPLEPGASAKNRLTTDETFWGHEGGPRRSSWGIASASAISKNHNMRPSVRQGRQQKQSYNRRKFDNALHNSSTTAATASHCLMIRSREWKLCRSFLFLNQQSFHSPDLNVCPRLRSASETPSTRCGSNPSSAKMAFVTH